MKTQKPHHVKPLLAIVLVIGAVVFARLLSTTSLFDTLYLKTVNSFFQMRGPITPADSSIVIIGIDEQSLAALPSKWPFPGSYFGQLVRNLNRAEARAIIFDVEFFEPNTAKPDEDFTFAESIGDAENVILAGKIVYEKGKYGDQQEYILKPNAWFLDEAVSWGLVNAVEDADGFTRRYLLFQEFDGRFYYPLSLKTYEFLTSAVIPEEANLTGKEFIIGERRIPKIDANTMMINYRGPASESFPVYSFSNVLDDRSFDLKPDEDTNIFEDHLSWGTFKNKIVFVGATTEELWDTKFTPFFNYHGHQEKMAGVETHAHALSTIMRGDFLKRMDPFVEFVILVFLVLLTSLFTLMLKPVQVVIIVVLELIVTRVGAYLLFLNRGELFNVVPPFIGVILAFVIGLMYMIISEQKEKYRIRKTFQHYVSPTVVDKMLENRTMPEFGGERRTLSILFSDIRQFSHFSEQHEPEFVVSRLSEYFSNMVEIIFKHNGTLDKFVGDEIMALFGAPYSSENHAEQACHAALDMLDRLRTLQRKWEEEKTAGFRIGIGINTGDALLGNLGSSQIFDYTVIGNEVNLAARLEGANKLYKTSLLISENTYSLIQSKIAAREIDVIRVVGIHAPVRIYEVRAMGTIAEVEQDLIIDTFSHALELYRERRWGEALKTFRKILRTFPDDGPSRLYTIRCLDFLESSPPADWDGIHNLSSK